MQTLASAVLWNSVLAFCFASIVACLSYTSVLKSRPALRHALWLLVLAKMISPPLIKFPTFASSAKVGMVHDDGGDSREIENADQVAVHLAMPPLSHDEGANELKQGNLPQFTTSSKTLVAPQRNQERWQFWKSVVKGIVPIALLISGVGTCLIISSLIANGYRIGQILSRAESVNVELQRSALAIAQSMGLHTIPHIRMVDANMSPMLWASLYRPLIVLPKALLSQLNEKQISAVIAHEIAHFARLDHLSSWFASLVLALFWWHPLVWYARNELRQAQEECCDAHTIAYGTVERRQYAETLLAVVDFQSDQQAIFPAVSPGMGNALSLRRRFEMLRLNSVRYKLAFTSKILSLTMLATLPCIPSWSEEANQLAQKSNVVTTEENVVSANVGTQDAWSEYKQHPFSQEALANTLPDLCRTADEELGEWYISGAFKVDRKDAEPLFVIQIYDGTKVEGFRLGMLAIISSNGKLIEKLDGVRVLSNFLSADDQKAEQLGEERIVVLPDLNADGISEIPIERWDSNATATGTSTGQTCFVYSARTVPLELVFQIKFDYEYRGDDVSFANWHLARNPESELGMAVIARLLVPADTQEHKVQIERAEKFRRQLEESIKAKEAQNAKDDTNKLRLSRVTLSRPTRFVDETQSPRVMATFSWSDEKQRFVGPKRGPHGAWNVIPLVGRESEIRTPSK